VNQSLGDVRQGKKLRRGIFLVVCSFLNVYLLVYFFFGDMGVSQWMKVRTAHQTLQTQTVQVAEENRQMTEEIAALKSDPFYIEQLARDRLGMIREGEQVYEFYDKTQ
jgi:cell division protein FtsB